MIEIGTTAYYMGAGIEPKSLAFWVSVLTILPLRVPDFIIHVYLSMYFLAWEISADSNMYIILINRPMTSALLSGRRSTEKHVFVYIDYLLCIIEYV